jgi:Rho-binding antiterminator
VTGPYQPVSCALHTELEAAATLGETVEIRVRDAAAGDLVQRGRILDVYARDGAEYLDLAASDRRRIVLRLDDVLALIRPPAGR